MKSRIGFVIMITIVFFYSYILGGAGSMLILYVLVVALMVSTILTMIVKEKLNISIDIPKAQVEKDGTIIVLVCIENKSYFPIPFIDIQFIKIPNFKLSDGSTIRISLGAYESQTIKMEYTAKIRGVVKIGVKNIEIKDYLGLLSFSLVKDYESTKDVSIIPRIFDIKANSKIILNSNKSQMQDDSGGSPLMVNSSTGEPGYEFREYIPGDSLHRIHWKLSAKKDMLMVRMAEVQGVRKKMLIIDPCMHPTINTGNEKIDYSISEEKLLIEESILETVLSIANAMIKADIDVELYIYENSQWVIYQVKDINSIGELQHKMIEYQFRDNLTFDSKNRMPFPENLGQNGNRSNVRGGESMVFTGALDKDLSELINKYLAYNICVDTISIEKSSQNTDTIIHENLWVLSTDKDFAEVFS